MNYSLTLDNVPIDNLVTDSHNHIIAKVENNNSSISVDFIDYQDNGTTNNISGDVLDDIDGLNLGVNNTNGQGNLFCLYIPVAAAKNYDFTLNINYSFVRLSVQQFDVENIGIFIGGYGLAEVNNTTYKVFH